MRTESVIIALVALTSTALAVPFDNKAAVPRLVIGGQDFAENAPAKRGDAGAAAGAGGTFDPVPTPHFNVLNLFSAFGIAWRIGRRRCRSCWSWSCRSRSCRSWSCWKGCWRVSYISFHNSIHYSRYIFLCLELSFSFYSPIAPLIWSCLVFSQDNKWTNELTLYRF